MDEMYLKIAEEITKQTREECLEHCRELPELDAFYFWNPVRGGVSVIVDKEGRALGAVSGIPLEKHIAAFMTRYDSDLELE